MFLRKFIKYLYFKILDVFYIDNLYIKRIRNNNKLVVLNLHRISDDNNPFYPSLSPRLFDKLLKYVSKNFNVIVFNEIENYKNHNKPNLILSFDDGFYDFLDNAMPILKKYNLKANLNVIPHSIETGFPVWDVLLGDILNSVPIEIINSIELPKFNMKLSQSNKGNYGLALTRHLKQLPKKKRDLLWLKFEKIGIEENVNYTKMLSREDVINISKIHEIGVHSYSHESMGIESFEFFTNDFSKCKRYFDESLKLPMNIYAFPSGSYKNNQIDYLQNHGIEHVLLVDEKYSNYQTHQHYRFTFYANTKSEVILRSVGFKR